MGLRVSVDLAAQVGFDNGLDALLFDSSLAELLDTMENGHADTGEIAAAEAGLELDLGTITSARFIWLEADGELNVYFDGVAATSAIADGSGGTYPTTFAGGETLDFDLDGTAIAVVFDDADETLTQVVNRINSVIALAGLATPVAKANSGELRLESTTTGEASTIAGLAGTALATLGLAATDVAGEDSGGASAPISLHRMADPTGDTVDDLKTYLISTVKFTSVYITNPSDDTAVRYRYCVVGDLSPEASC